MTMVDLPNIAPYGSAADLPSFKESEQLIAGFKLMGLLLPKEQRNQIKELQAEQQRTVGIVDAFYALLGKRNWVFTGDFNLPAIEHVIDTEDPSTAECRLIEYFKSPDRIKLSLRRLHRFDAMRPRLPLLQKALADYQEHRYYSTVLVLLAMMDGFVNDLEKSSSQGLHARPVEEMVAWDSVVGHHMGLSHAHQTFRKGFRRTDTSEVTELFRNGIMHGMLTDYDNEVVATKAWNRLFAVADWAEARDRQAKPFVPAPTLREVVSQWSVAREQKVKIEMWEPCEYEAEQLNETSSNVVAVCTEFLDRWTKKHWGPLGSFFLEPGSIRSSVGKLAVEAKSLYQSLELTSWRILRVRHVAAAVAHTDVELIVNGETYRTDLRWVHTDDTGHATAEWEQGRWTLSLYGPSHFLKPQ
ncbi:hypothetical protein QMQ05_16035 [Glutamicibacter ectropisis]|uniref:Uncharacterized protein n=1 Tax=Glutamicibacter ectropisis TaxID=3046593 RepID=A0AAU6WCX6_9MICC